MQDQNKNAQSNTEHQIPPEILASEQRRRDPRPAPSILEGMTDMLRLPSLDGGIGQTIVRYAPLLALIAAFTAGFPLLTMYVDGSAGAHPLFVLGQVAATLAFGLAVIWLAERSTLGLIAAGVGLVIQALASITIVSTTIIASIFQLAIGLVVLFSIRGYYDRD